MKTKKIQSLIFTENDQEVIIKTLDAWFTKDPQLIERTYILERNVFHLLVLKNKTKVLDKFLSHDDWKAVAKRPDRQGNTLFHFAVRNGEENQETLTVLLKHIPEMLNTQNNSKNTPLHDAVRFDQPWAVKCLLNQNQTERSIRNAHKKTALELALANPLIRQVILNIDLSKIQSLDLRNRPNSPDKDSLDSFHESFPLMSSRSTSSDSLTSPSSFDSSTPSSKIQEINLRALSFAPDADDEDRVVSTTKPKGSYSLTPYLKNLFAAYQAKDSSYQELFEQFCHLFCKYHLSEPLDLREFSAVAVKEVLLNTLSSTYSFVDAQSKQIQNRNFELLNDFSSLLLSCNLMVPDQKKIEFSAKDSLPNSLMLLTACKEGPKSIREFNFERVAHRALGLLSSYDLVAILKNLRRLYKNFDYHQKLVANYVVWQLFTYQCIDGLSSNSLVFLHMKLFVKCNVDEEVGLGLLGGQINSFLDALIENNSDVFNAPVNNYQIITQQLAEFEVSQDSFDQLVTRALDLKKGEREYEVKRIAQEMRILTIRFYQNVHMKEFGGCGWAKPESSENSPHIIELTQIFNKLSTYFVMRILHQPSGNIKNALQFMLELAHEVCPLDGERYPDLNQLMLICSVLNNLNVSRLSNSFELLSSRERKMRQEIEQMVSNEANSKWMREIYRLYRTTLPFLGVTLTDVTFAIDGNPNPLSRFEAVGGILRRVLEIKTLLNYKYNCNTTDLLFFLDNAPEINEDELYLASLRIQPRKNDVIDLDDPDSDWQSILNHLNQNFLEKNLLPGVIFNEKLSPPIQLANKLISCFSKYMKSLHKAVKELNEVAELSEEQLKLREDYDKIQSLIERLETTIDRIIEVNKNFYVKQNLMDQLSSDFYRAKIMQMKQQTPLFEQTPDLKKARRASLRHMASLVHKKLFFSSVDTMRTQALAENHSKNHVVQFAPGREVIEIQLDRDSVENESESTSLHA